MLLFSDTGGHSVRYSLKKKLQVQAEKDDETERASSSIMPQCRWRTTSKRETKIERQPAAVIIETDLPPVMATSK